ncbi:MAG: hypothetical protein DRP87_04715 [Spirochaetes bacterium]|nr:MAG: hypothetical protein DRP87_04715 [Spirochaetota bacterium]
MTNKELLKLLDDRGIQFVLIGGTAMQIYNSPRVTHDIDIAIRTLDVDAIIRLMYENNYYLITEVGNSSCSCALSADEADAWVEETRAGAVSFIELETKLLSKKIPHEKIDISTQVDFVFELGIPFTRLMGNARLIELKDTSFYVASPEDLLLLKEQRRDKTEADLLDIQFLKRLIKRKNS